MDNAKGSNMMKVYLVIEGAKEGSSVIKVFASETRANEYRDELEKNCKYSAYYYEVEEQELVD